MVVILILPSSSSEQTPPPSSSINGCDQYRLNGARTISNNRHEYRNRTTTAPKRITFQIEPINHHYHHHHQQQQRHSGTKAGASYTTTASATTATASKNYVRHVTRVNISDTYSQIEFDGDAEPVTKEGKSFQIALNDCHFVIVSGFQMKRNLIMNQKLI